MRPDTLRALSERLYGRSDVMRAQEKRLHEAFDGMAEAHRRKAEDRVAAILDKLRRRGQ